MKIGTYSKRELSFFVDDESEEDDREHHTTTTEFLKFTVDEECAVALWVMDSLCTPWIDTKPDFQKFLHVLIWRKSLGKDLSATHFIKLVDYYQRYEDLLSPFPVLKNNNSRITIPKSYKGKKRIEWLQKKIARAWYEIWDQHPFMRKRVGMHLFPNFPVDDQYLARQKTLEEKFWSEVDKKQQQFDCERIEAISIVSDYLPRAEKQYRDC